MARHSFIILSAALALGACSDGDEAAPTEGAGGVGGAGPAVAAAAAPPAAAEGAPEATEGEAAAEAPAPAAPQGAPRLPPSLSPEALREELRRLADHSGDRKSLLEERAALETERERLLQIAKEIEEARTALRQETERLNALIQRTPTQEARAGSTRPAARQQEPERHDPERLDSLARAVRGMKPDQAAAMLTRLPRQVAASLLVRMRPADAGQVLEKLQPEVAAELVGQALALPGEEEAG